MLNQEVELLPDVENTLKKLSNKFKLIVITKGDLLDQERKLEKKPRPLRGRVDFAKKNNNCFSCFFLQICQKNTGPCGPGSSS